jgi:hypothetical protein
MYPYSSRSDFFSHVYDISLDLEDDSGPTSVMNNNNVRVRGVDCWHLRPARCERRRNIRSQLLVAPLDGILSTPD